LKPSVPARRSTGRALTQRNRHAFLLALEEGTTVRDACRLIDKHHRTLYELRKVDEVFATAWDEAWEMGTQALEAEAHRRAVEGYVETTYGSDGSVLRSVHRYSDALLQKLLAGRRPEVYGNQTSIVGDPERPITFVLDSLLARAREELPPADARELEAGD
jgi:hypothetical protein